ncbi:MAG: carbohydrate kinase family protein [Bacilli bacterium]
MNKTILLVGGSNIDYIATANDKLIRHSSNIGELEVSFGGVMRNVVENLARLGNKCEFITTIGKDKPGEQLKDFMSKDLGVILYYPDSNKPTSSYLCINDNNHDMDVGINDMRIIEDLNADYISKIKDLFLKHDYIILDSNLSNECIKYIFENFKDKKIIVEGISATKIIKFQPYLDKIFMFKCNIYEAKAIMNSDANANELVQMMMKQGCKTCVISQGKDAVCFGENNKVSFVDVNPLKEVIKGNTTGCGDALFAGIIDHYLEGKSLKESIEFGISLSQLTLDSDKANNPKVSDLYYKH